MAGQQWLGLLITLLLSSGSSWATHIIGGDVSMRAVGTKPGLFRLQLNQYWDETKTGTGNRDPSVRLLVYRKQNPVLIEAITLNLQETLPLTFDNVVCAKLRNLSFTEARYYDTYQFDPKLYTDPGGYYIVWERCCRNDALTNVDSSVPAGLAMTFYIEFPPMTKNGTAFVNSSPDFRLPNGDYICLNKPFTFNVGATDADGDQLRYSLVTPLNGYTTRAAPLSTTDAPRNGYPTITWGSGYSLSNIIPGNPPLSINPSTGVLSVRASQQGLFLFTVQCEEYRNGVLIGVVRRDFQLPVVDCSKNTPPPAVVQLNSAPAKDVTWCGSQPLVLKVEKSTAWAYQWQKDGDNLSGATTDTLRVRETGVYTVVKSLANVCANDTISQAVKVTFVPPPPVKLSLSRSGPYCTGDTLMLRADTQPAAPSYRWLRDGNGITGEQQATIRVYQSGQYVVFARPAGAICDGSDTLKVTFNDKPTATLTSSVSTFCVGDSLLLTTETSTGYRYVWQRNTGKLADTLSKLSARQGGTYRVTVTNPAGCTALSAPLSLTLNDRPVVQFDSISPVCITVGTPILLKGQPAGGVFAGPGITKDMFDPTTAGVGRHKLTYTVTNAAGCQTVQSRVAVVSGAPVLSSQPIYQTRKGHSVQLAVTSNEPISRYQWQPPTYLDHADVEDPVSTPTETTPYQLTAVGANGCVASLTVLVDVVEPLYIPSAFSPNADGVNDTWIIPNIRSFPQCNVTIYNRWGEVIFHSHGYTQPWDGTYRQQQIDAGIYTYQIDTGPGPLPMIYRGQLTVVY